MNDDYKIKQIAALLSKLGASEQLDADDLEERNQSISGAYALVVQLQDRLSIARGKTEFVIDPGCYLYVGSARGPGGIFARLRRHFRRNKKKHWHVDHLTVNGRAVVAFALPDGDECDLVNHLVESPLCDWGAAGFGSSDCPSCRSHLVRLAGQLR